MIFLGCFADSDVSWLLCSWVQWSLYLSRLSPRTASWLTVPLTSWRQRKTRTWCLRLSTLGVSCSGPDFAENPKSKKTEAPFENKPQREGGQVSIWFTSKGRVTFICHIFRVIQEGTKAQQVCSRVDNNAIWKWSLACLDSSELVWPSGKVLGW